jgi:hypothetical protein
MTARFALVLACAALAGAPAPARAEEAAAAEAPSVLAQFKGSTLIYEHAASAVSLWRPALPMYNPWWTHRVSLRPEWHPVGIPAFVRARLDLWQEFTQPDDGLVADVGDLLVDFVWSGWKESLSGVRVGGNVRVNVPLSKYSRAQTLVTSVSPALTLARAFPLGEQSIFVSWAFRYTRNAHRFTTAQFDGPPIADCGDPGGASCAMLLHTGLRSAQWGFSQGPLVVYTPIPALSLTAMTTFFVNGLYALTPGEVPTLTGGVNPDAGGDLGPQHRFSNLFAVDASYTVSEELTLSLGAYTFASQLGPDGRYRADPLANLNTAFYLDLVFNVEALLSPSTSGRASTGRFLQ